MMNYIRSTPLIFFLLLATNVHWHAADAVSIEDMLFPEPSFDGNTPPSVALTFLNGVPTAKFSVGTPPQNFTGVFDTGSPITWMVSSKCETGGCAKVPVSEKFNQTKSSTNQPFPMTVEYDYLDGTHVKLKPELDTVTLAGKYQFPRHLIAEAYDVEYPKGVTPAANARIGAGAYSTHVLDPDAGRMVDKPTTNGLLRRAAGDDHYSTGPGSGSSGFRSRNKRLMRRDPASLNFLWVLGSDPKMYKGQLHDISLISGGTDIDSPFWKVPVKGFMLDYRGDKEKQSQEFALSANAHGTVASSTPYLMVPPAIAKALNKALGATNYNPQTGMYNIACSSRKQAPWLAIQFEALDAVIPPEQYINRYEHIPSGQLEGCFSAIVDGPDNKNVYLGGPFFRSFYIEYAFSGRKISVAESSVPNLGILQLSSSSARTNNQPHASDDQGTRGANMQDDGGQSGLAPSGNNPQQNEGLGLSKI